MRKFVQSLPHPIANAAMMLYRLPTAFFEDGLLTAMNADFRKSTRFQRTYRAAKSTGSFSKWELRWRIHVLCWFAELATRVEGDFVECGTDHGGTAMAVLEYLDLKRPFWLLDTFNGFGDKYLDYVDSFDSVTKTFADHDSVRLVRGLIPSTLPQVTANSVAYLHIDMNAVAPEIAALEHFWPLMPEGGVTVLDDYGWPRHKDQKVAHDAFAERVGATILQLPTGQGVIVKPPQ